MIPSNLWPHTHHDVERYYHEQYERDIQSGEYQPFLYPWDTLPAFVVIVYMLIPHRNRPWLRKARFLLFVMNLAHTVYMIRNVRARGMASTLGIGLISAWSAIYLLAVIVCHDPQSEFMRIERTEGVFGSSNGECSTKMQNGTPDKRDSTSTKDPSNEVVLEVKERLGPSRRHGEFAWQPYPTTPFFERLDWVLDLFANFRGAGWNWRPISTPPPPKPVQEQLVRNSTVQPSHSFRTHSSQPRVYATRSELLRANAKLLLSGYLVLDLIKTYASHDPYFWGYVDRNPAPYLPTWFLDSPVLIRAVRLVLCQFAIKYALQTIFALAPLLFAGVLGPEVVGARAEPWMYTSTWGDYAQVLDKGLAGWWSGWWHQTFRFAFETPSRKIIDAVGWNPKAPAAKVLQLGVAFGLSGALHASGSVTCHGSTHPLTGPLAFFLLQAVALFVENILRRSVEGSTVSSRTPRWVKRCLTFAYVHVWFFYTAPLLCDDFARGGVWLFEPVPISLFRGLGFGAEGDGWVVASERARWHSGRTWYRSGITF